MDIIGGKKFQAGRIKERERKILLLFDLEDLCYNINFNNILYII